MNRLIRENDCTPFVKKRNNHIVKGLIAIFLLLALKFYALNSYNKAPAVEFNLKYEILNNEIELILDVESKKELDKASLSLYLNDNFQFEEYFNLEKKYYRIYNQIGYKNENMVKIYFKSGEIQISKIFILEE